MVDSLYLSNFDFPEDEFEDSGACMQKYNANIRCWHFSCDLVDSMGNVRICKYFLNPRGRFTRGKVFAVLRGSK